MDLGIADLSSPEALEAALVGALRGRRLVFEVGVDRNLRDRLVASFMGRTLPLCLNLYRVAALRFPATLVSALAADAVFAYRAGDLWGQTALKGATGADIGQAFTSAINRLGLEPFLVFDEQGATRYVSRILAHGGVPAYCLGDLFRLVLHARGQGMDDAQDVVEILGGGGSLAQQVDRPVRRFLRDTGAIGRDYLQRVLELPEEADTATASPAVAASLGLPDYVVTEFRRLLPTLNMKAGPARRAARARLVFDPDLAEGPELMLSGAEGLLTWRIVPENGGDAGIVESSPARGEEVRVPVTPSMRWHVTTHDQLTGAVRESSILGVSESRPVLVFDLESMEQVPDARFAPRRLACILSPCDLTLSDGNIDVLRSFPLNAPAWAGWVAIEVAIDDTGTLTGMHESQRVEVRLGREQGITVSFANQVAGVTTPEGRSVFAGPPELQDVPWTPADIDRWHVSVSAAGLGATSFVPSPLVEEVNARIAAILGDTLKEEVTIRFLGPMGGGHRVAAAIVPGLAVTFPETVLFPGERAPVTVRVSDGLQLGASDAREVALEVSGETPRAYLAVTDGSARLELALRCPSVRWRLVTGEASTAVFAGKVLHGMFHPQDQSRVTMFVDTGRADESSHLVIGGFSDERTCSPLGLARGGVLRFDLTQVVAEAIRTETTPLRIELAALGRRCLVAELEEAVSVCLVEANYVASDGRAMLEYTIEQSRPMTGRALRVRSLDRPWARPFALPLVTSEDQGSLECSRLRPGSYAARVVLDSGDGNVKIPDGSAEIEFDIPWGTPEAEDAPVEDERELLLQAMLTPGSETPVLRDPRNAAPAAALLLGADKCDARSAALLLGAVGGSLDDWIAALDHAGDEYGISQPVMVRASVRLLGRAQRDLGECDPAVGRLASRVLRLAAMSLKREGDPQVTADLTGLRADEALNDIGILGTEARPVPLAALQKVLRVLRRLPATPLSINGRSRGIIEVRCWGLSPSGEQRQWLKNLVQNYPLTPEQLSLLAPDIAKACRNARTWLRDAHPADGRVVAALHVASFEAAAHVAAGTNVGSEAAEFLASVAKTFPDYVETRLAYFFRLAVIRRCRESLATAY